MKMLLKRMLDETEFLSDYGVRSLSRFHKQQPYIFRTGGTEFTVTYQPAESDSGLFGGNSNWRGPIWFPINYLIIESLHDPHFRDYVLFHEYFHGDNGRGVGASHQTGWTGLVAKLLQTLCKS